MLSLQGRGVLGLRAESAGSTEGGGFGALSLSPGPQAGLGMLSLGARVLCLDAKSTGRIWGTGFRCCMRRQG